MNKYTEEILTAGLLGGLGMFFLCAVYFTFLWIKNRFWRSTKAIEETKNSDNAAYSGPDVSTRQTTSSRTSGFVAMSKTVRIAVVLALAWAGFYGSAENWKFYGEDYVITFGPVFLVASYWFIANAKS
tara:strand:- start:5736 stop:6119 length:384 start_codon:yes stop_codon:yes gene_type:complete